MCYVKKGSRTRNNYKVCVGADFLMKKRLVTFLCLHIEKQLKVTFMCPWRTLRRYQYLRNRWRGKLGWLASDELEVIWKEVVVA